MIPGTIAVQPVEIAGMAMTSDFPSTVDAESCIELIGQDIAARGCRRGAAGSAESRAHMLALARYHG